VAKARKAISKRPVASRSGPRAIGFWEHRSIADLAADQRAKPLKRAEDLTAELWESDEDLEAFLVDVYRARDAGVA
jgi:hypothetical protein